MKRSVQGLTFSSFGTKTSTRLRSSFHLGPDEETYGSPLIPEPYSLCLTPSTPSSDLCHSGWWTKISMSLTPGRYNVQRVLDASTLVLGGKD